MTTSRLRGALALTACALLAGCAGNTPKSSPPPATTTTSPYGSTTPPATTTTPPPATGPRVIPDTYVRYRCAENQEMAVTYQSNGTRALVQRAGFSDLLKLVQGGTNTRYSNGKLTLNSRGEDASLEEGGASVLRGCRALPPTRK